MRTVITCSKNPKFGQPTGRLLKLRDKPGKMKKKWVWKIKEQKQFGGCLLYKKKKNQLSDSCKEDCSFKKDVSGVYVPVCGGTGISGGLPGIRLIPTLFSPHHQTDSSKHREETKGNQVADLSLLGSSRGKNIQCVCLYLLLMCVVMIHSVFLLSTMCPVGAYSTGQYFHWAIEFTPGDSLGTGKEHRI